MTTTCITALAADAGPDSRSATDAADTTVTRNSIEMTERVDALLAEYWREHEITPSEPSTDAEFLRRVYLDLIGTLPSATQVRQFLDDPAPTKRSTVIDQLVDAPLHPTHLANTWRRILVANQAGSDPFGQVGMQDWLRNQFVDNTRFDRLVGNFLTVSGGQDTGPVIYYRLLELKPEKLASSVAKCFLGVQLQCAECHDHPFVETTQEDFWSFAAFFARVRNRYGEQMSPFAQFSLYDSTEGEVTLPDNDATIAPRYPGSQSAVEPRGTRREQLSLWMASSENDFLGPATVNRVWSLLFGRGLVHPVDDMGSHNPSEHPQLLDELSEFFIQSGYDLRNLFQVLAKTKAYQRSSTKGGAAGAKAVPAEAFAQMQVKALTADQLFDSLRTTLKMPRDPAASNPLLESTRRTFVSQMNSQSDDLTKLESSVQQTLLMMNGQITEQFINTNQQGLTAALAAPYLDDEGRLELLFLASLSREPTAAERRTFGEHLKVSENSSAIQDIVWALVNSSEYRLNH
jgi:hypothetical protein